MLIKLLPGKLLLANFASFHEHRAFIFDVVLHADSLHLLTASFGAKVLFELTKFNMLQDLFVIHQIPASLVKVEALELDAHQIVHILLLRPHLKCAIFFAAVVAEIMFALAAN